MAEARIRLTDEERKANRRATNREAEARRRVRLGDRLREYEREKRRKWWYNLSEEQKNEVRARKRMKAAQRYAADPELFNKRASNWRKANQEKVKFYGAKYRDANRIQLRQRWKNDSLKKRYGLTTAQFKDLLAAQNGCCALCGVDEPGGRGRWHVDHCGATGTIRGLLCHLCNPGLGFFQHDIRLLKRAVLYLELFRLRANR